MPSLARRPADTEYASFYAGYVNAVPEGDIVAQLQEHGAALDAALASVPDERGGHRYAEGKWSIRDVIGHLIDTVRIFTYRALRIARGDTTPLAPFDENAYTAAAGADARTVSDLRDELRAVRASTIWLFASLADDAWTRVGIASGKEISVRALAYIVTGHAIHHQRILTERYGLAR
jgi:uncharacterized damage-inducible protein DinB